MIQQPNVVGDSCESTIVLKRKAEILRISYGISIISDTVNIFVNIY